MVHHEGDTLALHVSTHECAVSIIMLEEGNQTCRNGDNLLGRHVHVVNAAGIYFDELTTLTCCDAGLHKVTRSIIIVNGVVRLCDEKVLFLVGREIFHIVGYNSLAAGDLALLILLLNVLHTAEGSLDKAVIVNTSIGTQGVNQTNIGTFGGLNGADTTVVGVVNVTNLETSAIAVKTTRPQCRKTTLVRKFCQGVNLIHELGKLATTEEVTYHGTESLRIDELARCDVIASCIAKCHALFNKTLCAGKTNAALVGNQFTNGTHAAVTKVVNIINLTFAILEAQKVLHRREEVNRLDEAAIFCNVETELLVELVTTDACQVILLLFLKETVKGSCCLLVGGGITWAELAEDFAQSGLAVRGKVLLEGLDKGFFFALVNDLNLLDTELYHLVDGSQAEGIVSLGNNGALFSIVAMLYVFKGYKVL